MDFTGVIYVAPYKWRYFSLLIGSFWDQLVLGIDYTRLDFFCCLRLPARIEKHQELASKTYPTRIFGSPLLGEPNPTPRPRPEKKQNTWNTHWFFATALGATSFGNAHPLLPLPKPTWTSSRSGKNWWQQLWRELPPPPLCRPLSQFPVISFFPWRDFPRFLW